LHSQNKEKKINFEQGKEARRKLKELKKEGQGEIK
jgi:hypothetical protein